MDLQNLLGDAMIRRLKTLSETLWERQVAIPDVSKWLSNFDGKTEVYSPDVERQHAAHLLSHFTYLGQREVNELLVSIYRDLFRYELIQKIRWEAEGNSDPSYLRSAYGEELARTRFFGVGSPGESGSLLLYFFRQRNKLPIELFPDPFKLLSKLANDKASDLTEPQVARLVFIDDVLGTGRQARAHYDEFVSHAIGAAQRKGRELEIWYLTMFATQKGIEVVQDLNYKHVAALHVLAASQSAFSDESYVYATDAEGIEKEIGQAVAERYGAEVAPGNALGFGGEQLLLGLTHNVPDHTLPIFWASNAVVPWRPLFHRYPKDPEA